jgi:hypothetical protein
MLCIHASRCAQRNATRYLRSSKSICTTVANNKPRCIPQNYQQNRRDSSMNCSNKFSLLVSIYLFAPLPSVSRSEGAYAPAFLDYFSFPSLWPQDASSIFWKFGVSSADTVDIWWYMCRFSALQTRPQCGKFLVELNVDIATCPRCGQDSIEIGRTEIGSHDAFAQGWLSSLGQGVDLHVSNLISRNSIILH